MTDLTDKQKLELFDSLLSTVKYADEVLAKLFNSDVTMPIRVVMDLESVRSQVSSAMHWVRVEIHRDEVKA